MGVIKSIGELENEDAIVKIQDGNHGAKHPKSDDYTDNGIPFIMAKDLKSNSIDLQGCKFIPKELADNLRIGFAKSGDVLLTHKGSVGNVAIVPDIESYIMLTPQVTYYRVNETKLINKFLLYAFQHPSFQSQINSESAQSTRPYIGVTSQRRLKVYYYDLSTQQKISSILSAFDDLIENNTRRIAILEETARLIYREWFVNYGYPGHENDRLVDSGTDLGEVPEGWEVKKLLDVCELQTGKALKSKQFNEDGIGTKAVRIRNVRTNSSDTYTDEDFDGKYLVDNGDILVGMDGDFHMCRWADGQSVLVQRVARFRSKNDVNLSKYFFYWAIKKPIDFFNKTITGTTVAHLGKKHIKTIEIVLPPKEEWEKINKVFDPLYEQELFLRKKNKILKQARDLLLPKLISGKLLIR